MMPWGSRQMEQFDYAAVEGATNPADLSGIIRALADKPGGYFVTTRGNEAYNHYNYGMPAIVREPDAGGAGGLAIAARGERSTPTRPCTPCGRRRARRRHRRRTAAHVPLPAHDVDADRAVHGAGAARPARHT